MRVLGSALIHNDVIELTYDEGWYCALLADAWRKYLKVGCDGVSRVVLVCPYDTLAVSRSDKHAVLTSYRDAPHKKVLTSDAEPANTTTQLDTTTEDRT